MVTRVDAVEVQATGRAATPTAGRRFAQLDGIRALAVGCVLIEHCGGRISHVYSFGSLGVYTFFCLSGFLITGILLRSRCDVEEASGSRRRCLRQFYIRRCLRIFPLYYLALFGLAIANIGQARDAIPWYALYLSNFYLAAHQAWMSPISHFWTLAIEEQFYLVWPWFMMFLPRRLLAPAMVACIGLGLTWKVVVGLITHNSFLYMLPTFGCLDTLAAGALLALITTPQYGLASWHPWIRRFAWIGGLVLVVPFLDALTHRAQPLTNTLAVSVGICTAGVWLIDRSVHGMDGWVAKILSFPLLTYIGTISYGIYVWHPAVIDSLGSAMTRFGIGFGGSAFGLALAGIASTAVASLSWWAYERPINNLNRYFPYVEKTGPNALADSNQKNS